MGSGVELGGECGKGEEGGGGLKGGEVLVVEKVGLYGEEEGKGVGMEKEDGG